jgi:signal transduction histidine kinase
MKKFTRWDVLAVVVIAIVPTLIGVTRYLFVDQYHYGNDEVAWINAVIGTAYSFVITSSLYFGSLSILYWLNEKFPWKDSVARRIIMEVLLVFSYSTVVQFFVILAFSKTPIFEGTKVDAGVYFENILFGNTITVIVMTMVEGVYFFRRWKESLVLTEKMKSENMASQLNSLKNQLDPHFLFNSLNVLSTLIKKDTDRAELFIEDFARVYRYVLDVKDEMVVMLNQELKFLEAYSNLQKIRFGEALRLSVQINPRPMILYLPPLCLQELVSNAIKHNEVSEERPLKIEIYNEGDTLVVRNNLQRRSEDVLSMGVGLDNIHKRYSLLSDKEPHIEVAEEFFVAKIPLLEIESA